MTKAKGRARRERNVKDMTEPPAPPDWVDGAEDTVPVAGSVTRDTPGAYGAVEGRVQTITNRRSLRFTLYDLMNDRAVSCYLKEQDENILRDAWGQVAVVEGWVKRDSATGRPLTVRQVNRVTVRPYEGSRSDWRNARGVLRDVTDEPAEETIRRLRDA